VSRRNFLLFSTVIIQEFPLSRPLGPFPLFSLRCCVLRRLSSRAVLLIGRIYHSFNQQRPYRRFFFPCCRAIATIGRHTPYLFLTAALLLSTDQMVFTVICESPSVLISSRDDPALFTS